MDALQKLILLGQNMHLEPDGEPQAEAAPLTAPACFTPRRVFNPDDMPITMAALPNGRRMPLLKTMLTSVCERNCNYCCFRKGRDIRRETFTPDELGVSFMKLFQSRRVEGLFLSSGMAGGGVRTQDRLIASAEVLRYKLGFRGYIHLKIMPGAERAQVERAMQLADRISINLEGPTTERLAILAPQKQFLDELLQPLRWVEEIRRNRDPQSGWNGHWPSSTTQFVAGGAGESDLELLNTSAYLHHKLGLARVYFSGFNPIPGTPLEHQEAINPWRQHRLYQADFLLRDYGFSVEEMPFSRSGDLPLENDPKLAWAKTNLSQAPIEVNQADLFELMRIPGIGPKGARAILAARRKHLLYSLNDLKNLGIIAKRAAPYITLAGAQPVYQPGLW